MEYVYQCVIIASVKIRSRESVQANHSVNTINQAIACLLFGNCWLPSPDSKIRCRLTSVGLSIMWDVSRDAQILICGHHSTNKSISSSSWQCIYHFFFHNIIRLYFMIIGTFSRIDLVCHTLHSFKKSWLLARWITKYRGVNLTAMTSTKSCK